MKIRQQGSTGSMTSAIFKGTLWGMCITAVGAALLSFLIIREVIRETGIGYCAMAVILISSLISAYISIKTAQQKYVPVSLLSGLVYFAVLLGMNALLCKGTYEGVGVTALLVLAGVGTAILMELRPQKGRHSRVRKIRHG